MKRLVVSLIIASSVFAASPPSPVCSHASGTVIYGGDPVQISTSGTPVVTSQITVSGFPTFIWDVDVTTFLKHTVNADVDMTLQSPQGTVVTLTTDNGGGNDHVFDGTLWDDQANPGGQVPYTNNSGLCTDNVYVNLTTATPLTPEEPLGAFYGENPNGVWTLTVSDDLNGEGGSIENWALDITALNVPPVESLLSVTNDTDVSIPSGPGVVSSTINVFDPLMPPICRVEVNTKITHTFAADLDITVTSPSGRVVTLTTDNGAGNDNVFADTTWTNTSNLGGQVPYTTNPGLVSDNVFTNLVNNPLLVPEESLQAFAGEPAHGDWTLTISDDLAADGGNLDSWTLNLYRCKEADSDLDGTPDSCDACPVDGAKLNPGICGCGTPDSDTNANVIIDCLIAQELNFRLNEASARIGKLKLNAKGKLTPSGKKAKKELIALLKDIDLFVKNDSAKINISAGKDLTKLNKKAQSTSKRAYKSVNKFDIAKARRSLRSFQKSLLLA